MHKSCQKINPYPTGRAFVTPVAIAPDGSPVAPYVPQAKRGELALCHIKALRLRNELGRLIAHRSAFGGEPVPDAAWAMVLARIQIFGRGGCDVFSLHRLADRVGLDRLSPGALAGAARDASTAADAMGDRFQILRPDEIGALLRVTREERDACLLSMVGSYDESAEDRRRRLDRERKRAARIKAGAAPRGESAAATEPWKVFSMSRATWYRRGCPRPMAGIETVSSAPLNKDHCPADEPVSRVSQGVGRRACGPAPQHTWPGSTPLYRRIIQLQNAIDERGPLDRSKSLSAGLSPPSIQAPVEFERIAA